MLINEVNIHNGLIGELCAFAEIMDLDHSWYREANFSFTVTKDNILITDTILVDIDKYLRENTSMAYCTSATDMNVRHSVSSSMNDILLSLANSIRMGEHIDVAVFLSFKGGVITCDWSKGNDLNSTELGVRMSEGNQYYFAKSYTVDNHVVFDKDTINEVPFWKVLSIMHDLSIVNAWPHSSIATVTTLPLSLVKSCMLYVCGDFFSKTGLADMHAAWDLLEASVIDIDKRTEFNRKYRSVICNYADANAV